MNKSAFPMIATAIGLLLALLLFKAGGGAEASLPPLTQLFICEFGFFLTAAGAWVGVRGWLAERTQLGALLAGVGCGGLSLGFLFMGLALWSAVSPA